MSNANSVWEQNFRQPTDENITTELNQLSTQVATTNARVAVAEGTINTVNLALDARLDVLEPQTISLALVNGWLNFGSGFADTAAVKQGRLVQVVGLIRVGVTTAGTVLTTLPVGWRPPANVMCVCWCLSGAVRIDVSNGGQIVFAGETTAGSNPSAYLSLNLSFYTS